MFEPVECKAGATIQELAASGLLDYWLKQKNEYLRNLRQAEFGAVLLDYDGTVYAGGMLDNAVPDDQMIALLSQLARRGLRIGFASGRGASLRDALRQAFAPDLWPSIYVAYQDGAETGTLDDDAIPTAYAPALEDIRLAKAREKLAQIFAGWINPPRMRAENQLLGVYAELPRAPHVFGVCCGVALSLGLKVFNVGRMMDITLPSVSKRNLEKWLKTDRGEVLAVGDAGEWPGNDCELLASPWGISVGAVSADPHCCWRVTAETGIEATRLILNSLAAAPSQSGVMKLILDFN